MIKISFASNAGKNISAQVDLSGDEEGFTELSAKLKEFLESENRQIVIEADIDENPPYYEKKLEKLIVSKSDCPTLISVKDEKDLIVEGSINCLDVFVSNIEFVKDGYHIHYEYYEGNEWISPDSLPLVISSRSKT